MRELYNLSPLFDVVTLLLFVTLPILCVSAIVRLFRRFAKQGKIDWVAVVALIVSFVVFAIVGCALVGPLIDPVDN